MSTSKRKESKMAVLTVKCEQAIVIAPEKFQEFKSIKTDQKFIAQRKELLKKMSIKIVERSEDDNG